MGRDSPQETGLWLYMFRPTLDLLQYQHIPSSKEFFECEVTHFIKNSKQAFAEKFQIQWKIPQRSPIPVSSPTEESAKAGSTTILHITLCISVRRSLPFISSYNRSLNFFPPIRCRGTYSKKQDCTNAIILTISLFCIWAYNHSIKFILFINWVHFQLKFSAFSSPGAFSLQFSCNLNERLTDWFLD